MGVALLESTSILPILILSLYSAASSSTIGAIARQGPHHVAQKSTRTGLSDFNTSWSKFASVTSTIPLPAIVSFSSLNVALSADAPSDGVAGFGDSYNCVPEGGRTSYSSTPIRCTSGAEGRRRVRAPAPKWCFHPTLILPGGSRQHSRIKGYPGIMRGTPDSF